MYWTIVVTALLFFFCFAIYRVLLDQKKYNNPIFKDHLQSIHDFLERVHSLSDYITWVQRDSIKLEYSQAGEFLKNKSLYYRKEPLVKKFNEIYHNFDSFIVGHNRLFVDSQKNALSTYFDNIEGKSLDDQQRTAVITDEYSNLIIAGAGSGKTLTILAKVKYLAEKKNIDSADILLLSFTRETVQELNDRLQKINIGTRATTFHKLGYDIIRKYHSDVPAVTNQNTLTNLTKEYLQNGIFANAGALQSFIQYIACYLKIPEEFDNYSSYGEKIDTEKGIDFRTLKSKCEPLNIVAKAKHDTIQGERVKSVEELMIANFLYLNGIEYEYEKPYPYGDVMYRPDFYLTEYDIYLEHFGVDEDNRARWLEGLNEEKYVEEMKLKRETHSNYKTRLLETFSYYNRDHMLLKKLEEMLISDGVVLKPRDSIEIFEQVKSNDPNFGKEIVKLIESVINLAKSRGLNKHELNILYTEKRDDQNDFMYERQAMFLDFTLPILDQYNETLKNRNELDFNDMINLATSLVKIQKPKQPYKYIIIDEYQDISFSRFNLIMALRDLSGARLICVGDDWQSIYRFAGSDISLFSNFGKYVGKFEQLLIEQTYRNSQPLIDISSKFVQKNGRQIAKRPKSKKTPLENPVRFVTYDDDQLIEIFLQEIKSIVDKYRNGSILVLGRHRFDIHGLIPRSSKKIKYYETTDKLVIEEFENIDIKYLTVHQSKGTEADNVIVLNLRNDLLGFPNKMADDPLLSVLLSDNEEYRFAEERRLFYVALTRTKNEVVLMMPDKPSVFADELLTEHGHLLPATARSLKATSCPYCKTGRLVIRRNAANGSQFLGCSHYPSCDQTFKQTEILTDSILCSKCRSGFMIRRKGRFGSFLGCTNYPLCANTLKLVR